jgi:hypothetical protein
VSRAFYGKYLTSDSLAAVRKLMLNAGAIRGCAIIQILSLSKFVTAILEKSRYTCVILSWCRFTRSGH